MELVERPGYFGKKKQERIDFYNSKYGENNWALAWKFGEILLNFGEACLVYEDAYYEDSFKREKLWKNLFSKASDFYDNAETNVNSGLDYTIQESFSTHLQDIAVRRVGVRRGWKCKGDRLIQIRGEESEGYLLMPGIVEFHELSLIIFPDISPKWAHENSVEAFYQNNKYVIVK